MMQTFERISRDEPKFGGRGRRPTDRKPLLSPYQGHRLPELEEEAAQAADRALAAMKTQALAYSPQPSSDSGGGSDSGAGTRVGERTGVQRLGVGDVLTAAVTGAKGLVEAVTGTGQREAVIVEDGVEPADGQIGRRSFLKRAEARIHEVADEELAVIGRNTAQCPYIIYWFGYFSRRSASHIERFLRLYARPGEHTPEGLLSALAAKVRKGVRNWVETGELEGVASAASLTAGGIPEGVQRLEDDSGGTVAPGSSDPRAIGRRLGGGQSLEPRVRARMEAGFGQDFGHVRVHTDHAAGRIAHDQRAVAITVGQHVAFGAGTYRPGTLVGDAIIAHELAHTIQQRGGGNQAARENIPTGGGREGLLESDADRSAAGALVHHMGLNLQASPRERTGLQLQGCRPTVKQCPKGMSWGVVSEGTVGAGSFGCPCVYKCMPAPSDSDEMMLCPATGCSSNIEIVGEDYTFEREGEVEIPDKAVGWGGASTPLTAQHMCLCPGVDIEGTDRSEGATMVPIKADLTDIAGPVVDIAAAKKGGSPIVDPTVGKVIPKKKGTKEPVKATAKTPPKYKQTKGAVLKKDINKDRYLVWDSTNTTFQFMATLNPKGHLQITTRRRRDDLESSVLHPRSHFRPALDHFGDKVKGIEGSWSYGTNWTKFNELTKGGMAPKEAAKKTWTGELAIENGFTVVKSVELPPGEKPGHYSKVKVVFVKP